MSLQLLGVLVLVAVIAAGGVAHRLYATGAANAEARLVAESAAALREAREKAAGRAQDERERADAARTEAEAARAQGAAQAAQAKASRLAAAKAREERGEGTCPDTCFIMVQPPFAGQ